MMYWNQVCIQTTEQAADLISSVLLDAGAGGVELIGGSVPDAKPDEYSNINPANENVIVKAYYSEHEFTNVIEYIRGRIESLKYTLGFDVGSLQISVNMLEDTDWNANYKKHFKTFRAAGKIIIKPTWEKYQSNKDDIVIEMDPGLAFGSGEHETTKMCLFLVQKYMQHNAAVIDIGCGSGILGIACAKLGAREVLALDNDSVSVKVTQDNALANSVNCLKAVKSDLLENAENRQYDLVLANIVADVIIRLNADISKYMKPDAVYIASGIINDRLDDVMASLNNSGLVPVETLSMGEWKAIAVQKRKACVKIE
ncbi:MAG: 50S ribosomal protein L11 methyltransferase [Christensenellales bacterium]|jgi:ribosomal protein L11 methyltransferase